MRAAHTQPALMRRSVTLLLWAVFAAIAGSILALVGSPGLYAISAIFILILFAAFLQSAPTAVMVLTIWLLALMPYSWGLESGVLPKLYADEVSPLMSIAGFFPLWLIGKRIWSKGFASIYLILGLFATVEVLSFAVMPPDLIASRNFLATVILGILFLVLALQEAANYAVEEIAAYNIVWLTLLLAVLMIAERVTQRNPLLEHSLTLPYLSPELAAITEGVYRPYVTFFHPSEGATFMALGLPFVLRQWKKRKNLAWMLALLLVFAGLIVNATRGVWVAAAFVTLLLMPNAWAVLAVLVPVSAFSGAIAFFVFKSTPFVQRLTDPNNFLARLEYWKLGWAVFQTHPLIGVGHMQFRHYYLNYVKDLSNTAQLSLNQVYVIDNTYLTTLVEHGVLGFAGLLLLLSALFLALRKLRSRLLANGAAVAASLVHAVQMALIVYVISGFFADVHQFTKATRFLFLLVGVALGASARKLGPVEDRAQELQPQLPLLVERGV